MFSFCFFKLFPGQNNQGSNNIKKKKKKKLSYKSAKNVPNISTNNELSEQEKAVVVSSLHRVLKPFLLRRIKSDVILDLPQKVVKKYFCSIRCYIRCYIWQFNDSKTFCNLCRLSSLFLFFYIDKWQLSFCCWVLWSTILHTLQNLDISNLMLSYIIIYYLILSHIISSNFVVSYLILTHFIIPN